MINFSSASLQFTTMTPYTGEGRFTIGCLIIESTKEEPTNKWTDSDITLQLPYVMLTDQPETKKNTEIDFPHSTCDILHYIASISTDNSPSEVILKVVKQFGLVEA